EAIRLDGHGRVGVGGDGAQQSRGAEHRASYRSTEKTPDPAPIEGGKSRARRHGHSIRGEVAIACSISIATRK
ncbi:MAG TPA: hypothetical protein VFW54_05995, partial [Propionibacteriaceae bacterium]|nr:hypothetical protein [Propionibacteriaceae bacterium]